MYCHMAIKTKIKQNPKSNFFKVAALNTEGADDNKKFSASAENRQKLQSRQIWPPKTTLSESRKLKLRADLETTTIKDIGRRAYRGTSQSNRSF